jgi:hypothetical protein
LRGREAFPNIDDNLQPMILSQRITKWENHLNKLVTLTNSPLEAEQLLFEAR